MTERLADARAPKFGLPASLHIPIAATTIEAIDRFVGEVRAERLGRDRRARALLVAAARPDLEPAVPLWSGEIGAVAIARLHPPHQVWVDVDYAAYRHAWSSFGLVIPTGYFLDHVQNRRAMRLRQRSHPWLRLCPVHRRVNTSGGSRAGGEGMEYAFVAGLPGPLVVDHEVIYADPMDLTKMLDIEPGTRPLDGVRDAQILYYPRA